MSEASKRVAGRSRRPQKKVIAEAMKGFGQRLRALREKRGLTQQDLAKAIGTDWTQISRYEREVNYPTADRLLALSQALRTTPNGLLLGSRKQEEQLEFTNLRLYERFLAIDKLPKDAQNLVLEMLESVIARHELEHLADRVKRSA